MRPVHKIAVAVLAVALALPACRRSPVQPPPASAGAGAPAPSNRVDINASVRQNLGITFAKVELRGVASTLRVPGRFELLPSAAREYRAAASGKVELLVRQYQRVEAGTTLFRLDSPRWRELQQQLAEAHAAARLARAGVESIGPLFEAHEKHHAELQNAVDVWAARAEQLGRLQAAGGARGEEVAEARASLATARSDFAETLEKEAELRARRIEAEAQLEAAESRWEILIDSAASLAGASRDGLLAERDGRAGWQSLAGLEVRASDAGVVDALHATSGGWVEESAPLLTTVRPDQVRFRARGLQSDLGRLSDGLPAAVVPPTGGSLERAETVRGSLTIAPTADPASRTIDLVLTPAEGSDVPRWARAGVSGFLEVVTAGGAGAELAIPLACVARDGTRSVIFRRDPRDPNTAIRAEADLGVDDGRWVVINSGVKEGDEIVLDGVYQLMVATSGTITKGGHFHPDGTFHEGED